MRILCCLIAAIGGMYLGLPCVSAEPAMIAQSRHFTVYADSPADIYEALTKLDSHYGLMQLPGASGAGFADVRSVFEATLDGVYERVSEILDIRVSDFKAEMRIVRDQAALKALVGQQLGFEFSEPALYSESANTLFISLADLDLGLLVRQISRALICRFFIVAPPSRLQDVLADYVADNLRLPTAVGR